MAITGIKAVLLDLDGVLYVGDEAVPCAPAAVEALRSAGIGLRFVTNTTVRSHPQTVDKLRGLGFDVEPEEVVTPAALARLRCEEAGYRRVALIMNDALREDFEGLEEVEEAPDAVIMGRTPIGPLPTKGSIDSWTTGPLISTTDRSRAPRTIAVRFTAGTPCGPMWRTGSRPSTCSGSSRSS
jgi:Haloacid dehalogenase-like hydrolase